jgi:hypothetical protein
VFHEKRAALCSQCNPCGRVIRWNELSRGVPLRLEARLPGCLNAVDGVSGDGRGSQGFSLRASEMDATRPLGEPPRAANQKSDASAEMWRFVRNRRTCRVAPDFKSRFACALFVSVARGLC